MPTLVELWNRLERVAAANAPALARRVHVQRFADPSLFTSRVPGLEQRFVPSSRDGTFAQVDLAVGDLELAAVRRPPGIASAQGGELPVFSFPLRGTLARINGHKVERPYFWLAHGRPLLDSIETEHWAVLNIIVPDAAEFIESLGQQSPFGLFSVAEGGLRPIRSLVEQVFRIAHDDPDVFREPAAVFGMRECLLQTMYELASSVTATRERRGMARSQRLARKVSEFVEAHGGARVRASELARDLGVGVRTVQGAMTDVRGMSLRQYIRQKRLWDVRRALESRGDTRMLVRTVALNHGFWHLGRFAMAYCAEFGESPDETLRRAGGDRRRVHRAA